MLKREFEQRWGCEISGELYRVVEAVYTWAPWVPDVDGKDVLVKWMKGNNKAVQAFEAIAANYATLERMYFEGVDSNHRLSNELEKSGGKIQTLSTQLESVQTQLAQLHQAKQTAYEDFQAIMLEKNEYIRALELDIDSADKRFAEELERKEEEITDLKAKLYDAAVSKA